MGELLTTHHLLTLFLVVGAGAALGAIRFGPIRLGAAGALFVGLAVSAQIPQAGEGLAIVQQIGLAFFVYTVGIGAGASFFSHLRRQSPLLLSAALVATVSAVIALIGGRVLGLDRGLTVGLFTGALTSAPALDAASRITNSSQAAVGYAFGYPIGVLIGILVVSMTVTRQWTGNTDTPSLAATGLEAVTVRVKNAINTRHVTGWKDQRIRMSYLRRENRTRVVLPGEDLLPFDEVIVVGDPLSLQRAIADLGDPIEEHLANDRSDVAFERIVVSNPDIAGRTVRELGIGSQFGATLTRVRRGDLDLLARDDLALQLGDHVAVVVPIEELEAVQTWFGDSEKRVAEVDAMGIGIGMVLGMFLGAVPFPLPGGATFELGSAAGPLIVGMILGALRRTGPLVWTLPASANITIRHIGLLLFLAALGLGAGSDLARILTSTEGWRAALLAVVIVLASCLLQTLAGRILGLSAARTAGSVAGFLGQPAVLQAADSRVADERIEVAYATLFAFSIISKIFLVPLIWLL
ncbi:MAG: transporter [Actinobacteria bacterium]|nr:MAG: transporter [Actinomycetota bacterium]